MTSLIGGGSTGHSGIDLTSGNLNCVSDTFGDLAANSQILPVYVIWYNAAGHAWTTAQKNLVIEWFNNVGASPWWGWSRDYLDGANSYPTGIAFSAGVDDPETEGTSFNCGGSDNAATAVSNAITNATLPNNPNGLYFVLPSFTDIVGTGGCLGYHEGVRVGTPFYSYAVSFRVPNGSSGIPFGTNSPNGDNIFDLQVVIIGHETAEAVANGCRDSTFLPGGEVADLCSGDLGETFMSHSFLTAGGAPANIHLGSDDFWIQDIWSREQGGHCINGQTAAELSDLVPCKTAVSCPWSKVCVSGHCAIPTCSDGIQNQDESDTDCGATCGTYTCVSNRKCVTNWDCVSQVCGGITPGLCN